MEYGEGLSEDAFVFRQANSTITIEVVFNVARDAMSFNKCCAVTSGPCYLTKLL